MNTLQEALSKSMIKKAKRGDCCYLVVPKDNYDYLNSKYEENYIQMRSYVNKNVLQFYGCWVLSQEEFESYKKQFPAHSNDSIYKILSKETDPLKLVNYFKRHPSIGFQDTKWFKEITL